MRRRGLTAVCAAVAQRERERERERERRGRSRSIRSWSIPSARLRQGRTSPRPRIYPRTPHALAGPWHPLCRPAVPNAAAAQTRSAPPRLYAHKRSAAHKRRPRRPPGPAAAPGSACRPGLHRQRPGANTGANVASESAVMACHHGLCRRASEPAAHQGGGGPGGRGGGGRRVRV